MTDFLEAIRRTPDDDTARLVYADHLLEVGDERTRLRAERLIAWCTCPANAAIAWEASDAPTLGDLAWTQQVFPAGRDVVLASADGAATLRAAMLPELDEASTVPAWPEGGHPEPTLRPALVGLELTNRIAPYVGLELGALESLVLRGRDGNAMVPMLEGRTLRHLGWFPPPGAYAGHALGRCEALASLESLDLDEYLNHDLARMIGASTVRRLTVIHLGLGRLLDRLVAGIFTQHLTHLSLIASESERAPMTALGRVAFDDLVHLGLRHFYVDRSVRHLEAPKLAELVLDVCTVDADAREELDRRGFGGAWSARKT